MSSSDGEGARGRIWPLAVARVVMLIVAEDPAVTADAFEGLAAGVAVEEGRAP